MKLVFYSIVLNHHQACLADEFYKVLGDEYAFVETAECHEKKGAVEDYSKRPYLIKAWQSTEARNVAMQLALTAEVCVFGGHDALPFEKARMKKALLSFDMGERMLKRGWLNLLSPRILKMVLAYHLGGWSKKPIYKLCMSAFAAKDQYQLHSYHGKCFKWGYFTHVDENIDIEAAIQADLTSEITQLMWCGRFLNWKHPELPVQMAKRLKEKGYKFQLSMYGDDGNAAKHDAIYTCESVQELIDKFNVGDCVRLMGTRPNNEVLFAMRKSSIFLFTSDKQEGWGAVANEALSNGCVLVASDAIGSAPFLIRDGENGFLFKSGNVDSLACKVEWLLLHPSEMRKMQLSAYAGVKKLWSPRKAAANLLELIDNIKNIRVPSILEGPCSKA